MSLLIQSYHVRPADAVAHPMTLLQCQAGTSLCPPPLPLTTLSFLLHVSCKLLLDNEAPHDPGVRTQPRLNERCIVDLWFLTIAVYICCCCALLWYLQRSCAHPGLTWPLLRLTDSAPHTLTPCPCSCRSMRRRASTGWPATSSCPPAEASALARGP